MLIHHSSCWSITVHADPSQFMLIHHSSCWSITVHADPSQFMLIHHSSCWSITDMPIDALDPGTENPISCLRFVGELIVMKITRVANCRISHDGRVSILINFCLLFDTQQPRSGGTLQCSRDSQTHTEQPNYNIYISRQNKFLV